MVRNVNLTGFSAGEILNIRHVFHQSQSPCLNINLKWEYNGHTEWFIREYHWFCTLNRWAGYKLKNIPPSTMHKAVRAVNKAPEEQRKQYLFYLFCRTPHNLLKNQKTLKVEGVCCNKFIMPDLASKITQSPAVEGIFWAATTHWVSSSYCLFAAAAAYIWSV